MKRDMNLIRELLNVVEHADYPGVINRYGLNPYEPRVQYHLRLLSEAGFIRPVGQTSDGAVSVRLTWQGHEFLEMTRNDEVWERAKRYVVERTQGLSAAALQATLASWSQGAATDIDPWRYLERRPWEVARETQPVAPSKNGNGHAPKAREDREWRLPRLAPYYWWEQPHAAESHFQLQVTNNGPADALPVYGF
jgi:hypothetical protein